jgi:hypothetical protein
VSENGDKFPSADELYRAGALSNRFPSAAELYSDTDPDNEYASFLDDEEEEDEPAHGSSAPLSLIPTSTTNPKRPRTLAAGYDKKLKTLTVLFRDDGKGATLYNYYDVDNLVWANFKRARSKGRFIRAYLDSHDRGYPTDGALSSNTRSFLSDVAREYQKAQGGLQPGHSAKSKRGMRPYRSR